MREEGKDRDARTAKPGRYKTVLLLQCCCRQCFPFPSCQGNRGAGALFASDGLCEEPSATVREAQIILERPARKGSRIVTLTGSMFARGDEAPLLHRL